MNLERQLEEILSWRFIVEIWRRFPDRYALIETHPGGGQYDCLSLFELSDDLHSVLDLNRNGSLHVLRGRNPRSWPDWLDRMFADSRNFLDEINVALGLHVQEPLPPSTPTTIAFRFVCEFLTHAFGRLEQWECRNGFCDTSGYGGGVREEWFHGFPGIDITNPRKGPADGRLDSAYGYWFLVKRGKPEICLDIDGCLYKPNGSVHDLTMIYSRDQRIWPIITETSLELLP